MNRKLPARWLILILGFLCLTLAVAQYEPPAGGATITATKAVYIGDGSVTGFGPPRKSPLDVSYRDTKPALVNDFFYAGANIAYTPVPSSIGPGIFTPDASGIQGYLRGDPADTTAWGDIAGTHSALDWFSTGPVAGMFGGIGIAWNESSAPTTRAAGVLAAYFDYGATLHTTQGSGIEVQYVNGISAYGIKIDSVTGSLNSYGLSIPDVTGASQSNFAIKSGKGLHEFGDTVQFDASNGAQPVCGVTYHFQQWVIAGTAGVKDSVQICAKAADNTYAWRTLY